MVRLTDEDRWAILIFGGWILTTLIVALFWL